MSDISHDTLVLSDFGRDSDQSAEFWWQVNVLALLPNLEERLIFGLDGHIVSSFEIVDHIGSGPFIAVVEDVLLRIHVPLDLVDLVGSMRTVVGHNNGTFEFTIHKVGIKFDTTIFDKGQAIVN